MVLDDLIPCVYVHTVIWENFAVKIFSGGAQQQKLNTQNIFTIEKENSHTCNFDLLLT